MKNIKSILTLTLIGGSIILTGCSGNTEASAEKANNQPTTQAQTTSNNSASNYNVDMTSLEKDLKALEEGNLDYITFASSSTVKNFINLIGEENKSKLSNTKIISIGKITTKTILDNGLEVYKESEKASIESMIEAMCN